MKNKFKVISVIFTIMIMIMVIGVCACDKKSADENSSDGFYDDMVMATIDGVEITRADLGSDLTDAESEVIQNYIYEQLSKEFFADVEVEDTDVETQLNVLKAQVGEEQWPVYLMMYGGGDEESFKVMVKEALQQEKKITDKGNTVDITDSDLESAYNENPNSYNIVVMDVIFLNTEENLAQANQLYQEGKSLEEIAETLSLEISNDEHAYFESELKWDKDISTVSIGDMIITTEDSGNYILGRIKELNVGWNNDKVKEDMMESLRYDKGIEILQGEFEEFLASKKATILGKEFALYEESENNEEGLLGETGNENIESSLLEE